MSRYRRSIGWAFRQGINHIAQGISCRYDVPWCRPSKIIFCLTLRCNLRCKMCGIWKSPKTKELSLQEWKSVIIKLKEWLGPFRVQVAGGEIFIRDDIFDLVKFASENDVLAGVVSNGTLLDGERAERLIDAGLGYFDVSLDGINPETHDYIRGTTGVHEKALSVIRRVNELRKRKGSNLVMYAPVIVCGYNMNELIDVVHFVENENLDAVMFNPLGPACDADTKWWKKSDLWPKEGDLDKLYRIIDRLISMKMNGAKIINSVDQLHAMKAYFADPSSRSSNNCMVGMTNFLLSADGNIHLCFKMPPIGNYTDPFAYVWASKRAEEVRKRIKGCTYECSPGNLPYRRNLLQEMKRYLSFK